jgi:hypothetical protein
MGVPGVGHGWRHVQLGHRLPHIARDERDGGLPFGHHTRRFLDALPARRAEVFVLGHGAERVDVAPASPGAALAVTTHATLQVHTVIGVANGADALGDGLALPGEALGLMASRVHRWLHLL